MTFAGGEDNSMTRRSIWTLLICIAFIGSLAMARDQRTVAQESTPAATETVPPTPTPIPTPTAFPFKSMAFNLLANMGMEVTTTGPSVVRAATLTISPGQTSLPFFTEGTTVIAVTSGEIVVESDQATVQVVDASVLVGLVAVSGTPGPVDGRVVPLGWQVVLGQGSTSTISNASLAPATLIVMSVLPAADDASATPTP